MDEQIVMTKEDLQREIDSGNQEVINGAIAGSIQVGEPVVPEPEVQEPEEQEVPDIPLTDIIADFKPAEPEANTTDTTSESVDDIKAMFEKKLEEERTAQKQEIESLRAELNKPTQTPTDDDLEYATDATKRNRQLIEDLHAKLGSSTSNSEIEELKEKIAKFELADEQRQVELKEQEAIDAKEQALTKLFGEVKGLQSKVEHFKTERDISDIYKDYVDFKEKLSTFISTDDDTVISKAVHSAIGGESQRDIAFKSKLELAGINIPSEAETYLKLAEVVDLKNGVAYNSTTGTYDQITDEYGRPVNYRSLDDAFKLSSYGDLVSTAEKNAAKDIQNKLQSYENSATTLSNEVIESVDADTAITMDEAKELMDLPASTIKKNPELKRKYDLLMAQYTG